jgi:hypothetical protein
MRTIMGLLLLKVHFFGYKTSHNERTCKVSHMCEFIAVFAAALLEKMTLTTANNWNISPQFVLSNNLASCCVCEHDFFLTVD